MSGRAATVRPHREPSIRWHVTFRSSLIGFNLYQDAHRINGRLIVAHRSPSNSYRAKSTGHGFFSLEGLLVNGDQEILGRARDA